jgi:hypothetical protein
MNSYNQHILSCLNRKQKLEQGMDIEQITNIDIKKCIICKDWNGYKHECSYCSDVYHKQCQSFKSKCNNCIIQYNLTDTDAEITDDLNPEFDIEFNVIVNDDIKEQSKNKLFTVFKENNMLFNDNLIYTDNFELNKPENALFVKYLNKENILKLYQLKQFTSNGYFHGLEVFFDDIKGYGVKSSMNIRHHTLIGEYSGKVFNYRSIIQNSENQFYFTLLETGDSSTTLVIDAEIYGNITKFINSPTEENSKSNCTTIALNIENTVHILIYTTQIILKGQELLLDNSENN